MKRVLIVSDNYNLASAFVEIVARRSLTKIAEFSYRYTSINNTPEDMISLGYSVIDIKSDAAVLWVLENFDLVLSIHCKQIFPQALVEKICCVNLHPGFNPYNRGWYPQVFSIINKMPIGATLHVMNAEVDAGPIIAQEQVAVEAFDTSSSLYARVQAAEILLLDKNLVQLLGDRFTTSPPAGDGNYNFLRDFNNLCCLDLDSVGTLREHIDLLRALSHNSFDNAFYNDGFGRKIFVRINLELHD